MASEVEWKTALTSKMRKEEDQRCIPEFDGSTNVVEWLEQATLLRKLRSVSLMDVLPTRLRGDVFAVWSRMTPATRY